MYVPSVNIRTTNVELTSERRALISSKLTPLGRLLGDEPGEFDVVLRCERHRYGGHKYYLSVKLTTSRGNYHAVAIESRLPKALNKACDTLTRSVMNAAAHSTRHHVVGDLQVVDHYRLLLGNH